MKLERRRAYNQKVAWYRRDEILLLDYLRANKFSAENLLRLFPSRTLPSIRSKVRKLRIKHDLFGNSYRVKKQEFTEEIAKKAKPKVVFDAFAGAGHQTFIWLNSAEIVYASEKLKTKSSQFEENALSKGFKKRILKHEPWVIFEKKNKKIYFYTGDAVEAAVYIRANKKNVDLIDLDTCGSTLPTIPIFLTLLKPKHIVITHGEFHSMRFKREDVLRKVLSHRDVNKSPLPLSVSQMSKELDKAVKLYALRAHNETKDSFWLNLKQETWLGNRFHGMLRRYYIVMRPSATSDCLNSLEED